MPGVCGPPTSCRVCDSRRRSQSVLPTMTLMRAVLVKLLIDRQLVVDTNVVSYIALRLERSLDAARSFIDALDREVLGAPQRITRAIAADVLRSFEGGGHANGDLFL